MLFRFTVIASLVFCFDVNFVGMNDLVKKLPVSISEYAPSGEVFAQRKRPRHLRGEKVVKFKKGSKNSTKIDFDAADISGARKTPYGTLITKNKSANGYDFIWIRKKWHPEMVQSASSLDAGY